MADLESLRDIPGFKAILQSVLKSQIQLLLEQLSQNTGEESFILTASVNDGTLSHLGSKTGKGFLAGKQEIKSQFLGYCMKTHHKPATPDVPQSFQSGQPHSPLLQPYTDGMKKPRSSTPKGQPRASPYARPFSEKARRQSYQDTSDASFQNPVTSQSDSEGQDHTHSRDSTIVVKQESGDSVTVARGDTLTMPTDGGRPNVPSYPSPSVPFPSSLGLSHTQTSSEQTNAESNSRSDRNSESDQNESSTNNDAGEGGEFNSSVKIEPITENEMELEITGVEMADGSLSSDQWGQLAYAEGDNSYMNQGADQLQYKHSNHDPQSQSLAPYSPRNQLSNITTTELLDRPGSLDPHSTFGDFFEADFTSLRSKNTSENSRTAKSQTASTNNSNLSNSVELVTGLSSLSGSQCELKPSGHGAGDNSRDSSVEPSQDDIYCDNVEDEGDDDQEDMIEIMIEEDEIDTTHLAANSSANITSDMAASGSSANIASQISTCPSDTVIAALLSTSRPNTNNASQMSTSRISRPTTTIVPIDVPGSLTCRQILDHKRFHNGPALQAFLDRERKRVTKNKRKCSAELEQKLKDKINCKNKK